MEKTSDLEKFTSLEIGRHIDVTCENLASNNDLEELLMKHLETMKAFNCTLQILGLIVNNDMDMDSNMNLENSDDVVKTFLQMKDILKEVSPLSVTKCILQALTIEDEMLVIDERLVEILSEVLICVSPTNAHNLLSKLFCHVQLTCKKYCTAELYFKYFGIYDGSKDDISCLISFFLKYNSVLAGELLDIIAEVGDNSFVCPESVKNTIGHGIECSMLSILTHLTSVLMFPIDERILAKKKFAFDYIVNTYLKEKMDPEDLEYCYSLFKTE